GAEARSDSVVVLEVAVLVPHRPEVHVASVVLVPGIAIVELAGAGGRWPERAVRIALGDGDLDHPVEAVVVDQIAVAILLRQVVPGERADDLVVAAPEGDRGMRAEALNLVADLGVDDGEELGRRGVLRAGEHHVLPDEQAELVAEVVEIVELVETATPYADHV